MDKYTEFLLDRIFEIREDYRSGGFSESYYQNVVAELVSCLARYTDEIVDNGYVN